MKEHINNSSFYKQLQTTRLCTFLKTDTLYLVALL